MTRTRPSTKTARQYLRGLLQSERRNMERMEQIVPDSNEQTLQHFISNPPWDAEERWGEEPARWWAVMTTRC